MVFDPVRLVVGDGRKSTAMDGSVRSGSGVSDRRMGCLSTVGSVLMTAMLCAHACSEVRQRCFGDRCELEAWGALTPALSQRERESEGDLFQRERELEGELS